MGAAHGSALRPVDTEIELQRETKDFARCTWLEVLSLRRVEATVALSHRPLHTGTLEDVVRVHERFQKTFGLSISASQFGDLILLKAPETVAVKEVFDALDADADGRIDGLEFLAALACVCRASFEEKARFAFDLFDFNRNGSLSVTETALLMKSVWVGMALLTGRSIASAASEHQYQHPNVRRHRSSAAQSEAALKGVMRSCLDLAESAFARYDKDGSDALSYEEFIEWARSNREFMLQVEQFRLVSEKAIGFEEELSLPDGSDVDSDLEDEAQWQSGTTTGAASSVAPVLARTASSAPATSLRAPELPAPWIIEPLHLHLASKALLAGTSAGAEARGFDMPPPVNLALEWIYGANGPSGRNSCRYLATGDVVFVVSKYAIVYSPEIHRQRFYQGHRNAIACLVVSASGEIVATGDGTGGSAAPPPEIHIWRGATLQCLAVLRNFHVDGVLQLSFPAPASAASSTMHNASVPAGAGTNINSSLAKKRAHTEWLVASVGNDANSSLALWDWQLGKLLASGRAHHKSGKRVLAMALSEDGSEVLVCGVRFVLFHQLDGRFFKLRKPQQMEKKLTTVPACAAAAYYGPDHAVVGTSQGQLFQFQRHKLTKVVQAHSDGQSVNACLLSCRSMVLFTAGKDGHIKQWDSTLSPIGNPVDLHALVARTSGAQERAVLDGDDLRIHSLAYDATRRKLLVGTRMGHILEFPDDDCDSTNNNDRAPRDVSIRIVASSHDGRAISCVAMARTGTTFASCGAADRSLKLWSLRRRTQVETLRLRFAPLVAEFSTSGELLAVGGLDGSVLLLPSKAPLKALATMKNTNSGVTALRFAPQDDILAVACANGLIYLYTLDDGGRRFRRHALLKPFEHETRDAESSAALSLDFSIDGAFLKSQHASVAPLRFWDLRQRASERVTAMHVVRNAVWQTYSSTIGWHVGGLGRTGLRAAREADRVRCAQASANQTLLLSMDARGRLALAHFPCIRTYDAARQREWLEKAVDNAHLASGAQDQYTLDRPCAGFALNDSVVLSSSCSDGVVCQWRVEKEISDTHPRRPRVYDNEMMSLLSSVGLEDLYFGWDADSEYVARQPPVRAALGIQVTVSESSLANAQRKTEAPDLDLTLAHVYGMNLRRTAMNQALACAGGGGAFVYAAGTLVVVDHVDQRKGQRVFQSGLSHSVACLVKHATHPLVAVGSREDSKLVVWNVDSQRKVAELPSCGEPGAAALVSVALHDAEHSESDLVAAVWKSRTHVHSLVFYSWMKQRVVAHAHMTTLPVLFSVFCGGEAGPAHVLSVVTGGVDHATFWRLDTACGHLQSQQGVFGRHALVQTLVCGVAVPPFILTGTMNGSVVLWANGVAAYTLAPSPASHSRAGGGSSSDAVVSLVHIPSTRQVVGATQSGTVHVWKYAKPVDAGGGDVQGRAAAFLEPVRSVDVFAAEWKYLRSSVSSLRKAAAKDSGQGGRTPQAPVLVRSLCLLEETNGALVAITDGHVVHLDAKMLTDDDGAVRPAGRSARVVLDHHQVQRGVAVHPRDFVFATCCASGSVCVWSLHTQSLMKHRDLHAGAYALCWNAAGDRLAVSLADGSVSVLDARTLEPTAAFRCGPPPPNSSALVPPKWCSTMKYSPLGSAPSRLALACRDFNVYVYACSSSNEGSGDTYELVHEFVGHTARIEALDFSLDGRWLQSSSSALDAQVVRWSLRSPTDTTEGSRVDGVQSCSLADDEWSSWGNTFAGPAGGLPELYGTKVTALDRIRRDELGASQPSSDAAADPRNRWSSVLPSMAVGTEDGRLLLCWYPLPSGDGNASISKEYVGFLPADSAVRSVEFSFANGFVVACARNYCEEALILVWKTDYEEEVRQLERSSIHPLAASADTSSVERNEPFCTVDTSLFEADPLLATDAEGDEFLAVKPWLGAIREPSTIPPLTASGSLPDHELTLEFVYGVNAGATASNNAFYADDAWEIVYAAAAVGVVYNTKTQRQILNQSHQSHLVSAVAVHPKGDLVATGECGVRDTPKIVLWDANSGGTIVEVETNHARGVRLLGFSPSGGSLVSVGMEDDHIMNVFLLGGSTVEGGGVAAVKLLTSVKTSKQAVWNLCFTDDNGGVVTCGDKHILFWQPLAAAAGVAAVATGGGAGAGSASSGAMSMKRALFASHKLCKADANVLAVALFVKQQVVSSQADGSLYVWKERRCVDVKLDAHRAASIPTLCVDKKRQLVFSGGSDGRICAWNAQLECVRTLDVAHIASTSGLHPALTSTKIQSLCARDGRFLVSTAGGEICEIVEAPSPTGATAPATPGYRILVHVRGHCRGELWGLAAHPSKIQFATAGDDGSVRLWDAPTRSLLALHAWKAGGRPRALAFSSDGSHLAVGTSDGSVRVLSAAALDAVVLEWKCSLPVRGSSASTNGRRRSAGAGGVRVLKYSPDGCWLAVGCQDQRVHVFDAHTYKKVGECRGHSGAVTHLDFSKDGHVLQSVASGAGELLFWLVASRQRIVSASAVRDVPWATWSCPFGWPVQGVWPPESDGSDVNAVARSEDARVVATGDDAGLVKLFRYPSVAANATAAQARAYAGHASHVTNVTFTHNDLFLLSTGGRDQSVCQFARISGGAGGKL
ncbi:hypothetical protein PybrP1_004712 [[Pythium] brassicae (nom. inval.)]|nr:hypothetical protein PybrP1_004712 [[Pythium] brassicae (nom. inval.)]